MLKIWLKTQQTCFSGKVQPDHQVACQFLVRLFPPGSSATVSTAVCKKVVLPRFYGMVIRSANTVMASCLPNGHITKLLQVLYLRSEFFLFAVETCTK